MAADYVKIDEKIVGLSKLKKWDELVGYLKEQLEKGTVGAEYILKYARERKWKSGRFIIDPLAINSLGLIIDTLQNENQAKYAHKFYELAGDRDDDNGYRNYAICLLHGQGGSKKSSRQALSYAECAVKLNEKDTHQLILYDCLRKNNKNEEASTVLSNFLKQLNALLCDLASKKGKATQEEDAFELCNETVEKISKISVPVNAEVKIYLDFLTNFVNVFNFPEEFETLKQKAYFIKGKIYESLDEYSEAMRSYCEVTDEKSKIFKKAIAARAGILKMQARILLYRGLQPAQNVQSLTDLKKFWSKEEIWFHSVDQKYLRKECEIKKAKIMVLNEVKIYSLKSSIKLLNAKLESVSVEEEATKKIKLKIVKLERQKYWPDRRMSRELKELSKLVTPYLPENRQSIRTHGAESLFFDFSRSKKKEEVLGLTNKIIDQRVRVPGINSESIELKNISTRRLITAEKLFQAVMWNNNNYSRNGLFINLWLPIDEKETKPWFSGKGANYYAPFECYKIGETQVKATHRTNPKNQRLGDSFLPQIGPYSSSKKRKLEDVYSSLMSITASGDMEKTKKIAEWMIRYGKSQNSITLDELKNLYPEATQDDVDKFNRICFLVMAKEQVQWLSATDSAYQLGMAVAQARCLIMMEAGFITLKEAFSSDALFGIYTGSGLADDSSQLANPCKKINDLYLAYLQSKKPLDYMVFFKKYISQGQAPQKRTWVLTREQAHLDLKYVYGGDGDTDGEEYHSDLSDSEAEFDLDVQASRRNFLWNQ